MNMRINEKTPTEYEEIVFIEYHSGRPHSVITHNHWDHRKRPWFNAKTGGAGISQNYYDFEYCKANDQLYWHKSGYGGDSSRPIELSPTFLNGKMIVTEFWAAPSVTLGQHIQVRDGKWKTVAFPAHRLAQSLAKIMNVRLAEPRGNPFDDADGDTPTVYCSKCNDNYSRDSDAPCEHLTWCDECAEFAYGNVNGRHTPLDGKPMKHKEG